MLNLEKKSNNELDKWMKDNQRLIHEGKRGRPLIELSSRELDMLLEYFVMGKTSGANIFSLLPTHENRPANFSTNLLDAWKLIEMSSYDVELSKVKDFFVCVILDDATGKRGLMGLGQADTASLAICKAFLEMKNVFKNTYSFRKLPKNYPFLEMTHAEGNGVGYGVFNQNEEIIAYVFLEKEYNSEMPFDVNNLREHTLHLEMIEVLDKYKEQGHGTEIIKQLFHQFKPLFISGMVMEKSEVAYSFWQNLGANLSVASLDEMHDAYKNGLKVTFELDRKNVFGF